MKKIFEYFLLTKIFFSYSKGMDASFANISDSPIHPDSEKRGANVVSILIIIFDIVLICMPNSRILKVNQLLCIINKVYFIKEQII